MKTKKARRELKWMRDRLAKMSAAISVQEEREPNGERKTHLKKLKECADRAHTEVETLQLGLQLHQRKGMQEFGVKNPPTKNTVAKNKKLAGGK